VIKRQAESRILAAPLRSRAGHIGSAGLQNVMRARLLALTTNLTAGIGLAITFLLVGIGVGYGTASVACLIALIPYIALILLAKKTTSRWVQNGAVALASAFTIVGNIFYFGAVVLHPSGSAGDFFLLGTMVELFSFAVLPILRIIEKRNSSETR
jgi:hypothetical protein